MSGGGEHKLGDHSKGLPTFREESFSCDRTAQTHLPVYKGAVLQRSQSVNWWVLNKKLLFWMAAPAHCRSVLGEPLISAIISPDFKGV